MAERLRWWTARQLDRLPFTCWADLVGWAQGWHSLRDVRQDRTCTTAPTGRCYCGKVTAAPALPSGEGRA
jgi:hypothetical protein